MLKGPLLHPEIAEAIAKAGHGSTILIADANYPCSTERGPNAKMVYLNLAPGVVSAMDVLQAIVAMVPIEQFDWMRSTDGREPEVITEFKKVIGHAVPSHAHSRTAFYLEAKKDSTCLVIATGEQRLFANALLTIGVVAPEA